MILIDSNILIYSAEEKYKQLRNLFGQDCIVSAISKLEVHGFHNITEKQIAYFESIFALADIINISDEIIELAIRFRQKANMSVGDAIIAATAKIYDCELYTRNVEDFKAISNIRVTNPIPY